ncbi:MAG TPA: NAD(P)/FAD-dependent oxidoreductase [Nocardioides sp.]|uniref:phytoene desaturase family protein n=1 Tax=Nocardioides sp. TaxID=35761 RepID=UPI002EDAEA95
MTGYDAIVVGAGPNGLVAANHLLDAGWSVLVLEAQPEVGGAVRSDTEVHPGFVHDTFSAFYPLAAASAPIGSLNLEQHGLVWEHAPAALGHALPDGRWAMLHRDRTVTAALLEDEYAGDGDAWLALCEQWDRIGDQVVAGLLTPFPPVRPLVAGLARLPRARELVRDLVSPVTELGRRRFGGDAPRLLLAGNAGHADIPLDGVGSGLMALMLCLLGQTVGFPVPRGGAGELTGAMARRATSLGGEIRCGAEVTRIEVGEGRVRGVRLADGERIEARHAVVADTSAPALYGRLVDPEHLPWRVRAGMRRFELDPATIKVDWALDGPVPWQSEPPYAPGTVHVADSLEQLSEALGQVAAGVVPSAPFLLSGQMTTADPTRSPAGTESLWAYTHVPHLPREDAGGEGITGPWDDARAERLADRIQARFEALAPGFGSRVLARRVLGPHELERRDANLIGGALNGGTARPRQQLVLRPVPGLGRAETPVRGLYLGSASAHPGGGVHGAPGHNAARAAIAHRRARRLVHVRRQRHE